MKKSKISYKPIFLIIFLLFLAAIVQAQPLPTQHGGGGGVWVGGTASIDGELNVFILLIVVYGLKKRIFKKDKHAAI